MIGTLLTFLIAATMQNLVLTTGFDSSLMLKITRNPRQILRYNVLLLVFTVATAALFYPIDRLLPTTWFLRILRPLIIVCLTCLLYLLALLLFKRFPALHRRVRHLLPLAAFNNTVVGVALLMNVQISVTFGQAIALAAGAAIGFWLLSATTAEAIERMDNPEIPSSFRGLPATLLFLGLFALALMGFATVLNLT